MVTASPPDALTLEGIDPWAGWRSIDRGDDRQRADTEARGAQVCGIE
jgi:hypothetical protein